MAEGQEEREAVEEALELEPTEDHNLEIETAGNILEENVTTNDISNVEINDKVADIEKKDESDDVDDQIKGNENEPEEVRAARQSRELKSILALSKEAKLDTNIGHKRKSLDTNKSKSEQNRSESPIGKRAMRSQNPEFVIKQQKFLFKVVSHGGSSSPEGTTTDKVMPIKLSKKKSLSDNQVNSDDFQKIKKLLIGKVNHPQNKDVFCWRCHKSEINICCETCCRSYHIKCLKQSVGNSQRWVCPECVAIMKAESTKERSRTMKELTLEQLCGLLKFALKRMMQVGGAEPFLHPVDESDFPDYRNYIIQPMDLTRLEKNIKENLYGSTQAFEADAKWIFHNSMIFNSAQAKITAIAKAIMKVCKQEMIEIENCASCYLNANTKRDRWFVEVCPKPHLLVWAKLKGFPYWPAKAMRSNSLGMVDVRFFGAHDRAWVPDKECFLYSMKDPNCNQKMRNDIAECVKELDIHIENLKKVYKEFCYAPYRTPYLPEEESKQLKMMLPNYDPDTCLVTLDFSLTSRVKNSESPKLSQERSSKSEVCNDSADTSKNFEGYGSEDDDMEPKLDANRREQIAKITSRDNSVEERNSPKRDEDLETQMNTCSDEIKSSPKSSNVVKTKADTSAISPTGKSKIILPKSLNDSARKRTSSEEISSETSYKKSRRNSDISVKSDSSRVSNFSDKINRVDIAENVEITLGNDNSTGMVSISEIVLPFDNNTEINSDKLLELSECSNSSNSSEGKRKPIVQLNISGDENQEFTISPQNKINITDKLIHKFGQSSDDKPEEKELLLRDPTNTDTAAEVNNSNQSDSSTFLVKEVEFSNNLGKNSHIDTEKVNPDKEEIVPASKEISKPETEHDLIEHSKKEVNVANSSENVDKYNAEVGTVNDSKLEETKDKTEESKKIHLPKKSVEIKKKKIKKNEVKSFLPKIKIRKMIGRAKTLDSSSEIEAVIEQVEEESDESTSDSAKQKEESLKIVNLTENSSTNDNDATLKLPKADKDISSGNTSTKKSVNIEKDNLKTTKLKTANNQEPKRLVKVISIKDLRNKSSQLEAINGKFSDTDNKLESQNKLICKSSAVKVTESLQNQPELTLTYCEKQITPKPTDQTLEKSSASLKEKAKVQSEVSSDVTGDFETITVKSEPSSSDEEIEDIEAKIKYMSALNISEKYKIVAEKKTSEIRTRSKTEERSKMMNMMREQQNTDNFSIKIDNVKNKGNTNRDIKGNDNLSKTINDVASYCSTSDEKDSDEKVRLSDKKKVSNVRTFTPIHKQRLRKTTAPSPTSSNTSTTIMSNIYVTSRKSDISSSIASNSVAAVSCSCVSSNVYTNTTSRPNMNSNRSVILPRVSGDNVTTSTPSSSTNIVLVSQQPIMNNQAILLPNQQISYGSNMGTSPMLTVVQPINNSTVCAATTSTPTTSQRLSVNVHDSQNYIPHSGVVSSVANVMVPMMQAPHILNSLPSLAPLSSNYFYTFGQKKVNTNSTCTVSTAVTTSTSTDVNSTLLNGSSGFSNNVVMEELDALTDVIPENLSHAISELVTKGVPSLKPRPPGPLSAHFDEGLPSTAGPIAARINSISHRLSDYLRGMLVELIKDFGDVEGAETELVKLRLEIEELKQRHAEEMMEIKKNIGSILRDIQRSIVEEKKKIVDETRKACELETIERVEEAKSKQWCANCFKEAQFYCCWNTSYCDYPCQQKHWLKHMSKCTQNQQQQQQQQHQINHQASNAVNSSRIPNQSIMLRPMNPVVRFSGPKSQEIGLVAKPTKVYVNRGNVKTTSQTLIKTSTPNGQSLTLVESSPGNFELLNNGPSGAGGKMHANSNSLQQKKQKNSSSTNNIAVTNFAINPKSTSISKTQPKINFTSTSASVLSSKIQTVLSDSE